MGPAGDGQGSDDVRHWIFASQSRDTELTLTYIRKLTILSRNSTMIFRYDKKIYFFYEFLFCSVIVAIKKCFFFVLFLSIISKMLLLSIIPFFINRFDKNYLKIFFRVNTIYLFFQKILLG